MSLPDWAPDPAAVAAVTPSYTRGGYDDDDELENSGAEQGTFTDTTSPTEDHVDGLIAAACDEITGRVGVEISERCFALAGRTAVWHVAAAISAGKLPGQTDDARGEYTSHIANYRFCLDELIAQSRAPTATRLV